jgi:urease accessory protein
MPKKAVPYPVLLALAAVGVLILQVQVDPTILGTLLTHNLDRLSHRTTFILAASVLGLIAVRLGGKIYWPAPSIYVALLMATVFFDMNRMALHLLEYGIIALLILIAALLAVQDSVALLIALVLARNMAVWRFHMLYPYWPQHAFLFLCTANFAFYAAALQAVGMGIGLIFNWWPLRFVRLSGAALIGAGLLTYFYRDMHDFAVRMLY